MWLKVIYTLFMAVLIPVYLVNYGPTNFLYFCDVALLLTLVGIWKEDSFFISMCAVGIIGVQAFWVSDFLMALIGFPLTGLTAYMFNPETSLFLRSLSLYHGWLPFLLWYLVYKVGYDPRGFPVWTLLAWILIGTSFFFLPPPSTTMGLTPVNVNYVWGLKDSEPQTWMSTYAWLALMVVGLPGFFYWPVHILLKKFYLQRRTRMPA